MRKNNVARLQLSPVYDDNNIFHLYSTNLSQTQFYTIKAAIDVKTLRQHGLKTWCYQKQN